VGLKSRPWLPLGPIHPAGEVFRLQVVALHPLAAGFGVDGVQVEAVRAGDQAVGGVEIAGAVRRRCAPCRGSCQWPGRRPAQAAGVLETADVVALPAVQADGDARQPLQGQVCIYAQAASSCCSEGCW
jgi:hypothetical protein